MQGPNFIDNLITMRADGECDNTGRSTSRAFYALRWRVTRSATAKVNGRLAPEIIADLKRSAKLQFVRYARHLEQAQRTYAKRQTK